MSDNPTGDSQDPTAQAPQSAAEGQAVPPNGQQQAASSSASDAGALADGAEAAVAAVSADAGDSQAPTGSESPAASEAPEDPLEALQKRLDSAEAATKAIREKMLRVAADFENYRKRSGRDIELARERGTQQAVGEMLAVFDNLDRATGHVAPDASVASVLEGLSMVHSQFNGALGKLGIARVEALGKPFDPAVHESIQYNHSDEHGAGSVMAELQPGYTMGKSLLRPALVVVSRGPEAQENAEASAPNASEEPTNEADSPSEEATTSGQEPSNADEREVEEQPAQ